MKTARTLLTPVPGGKKRRKDHISRALIPVALRPKAREVKEAFMGFRRVGILCLFAISYVVFASCRSQIINPPLAFSAPNIALCSPENESVNLPTEITLSWNATPGTLLTQSAKGAISITGFELYFARIGETFGSPSYISETSTHLTGLSLSQSYQWQVAALQSDGQQSRSETYRFTTIASSAQRVEPEDLVYLGAFLTPEWVPGNPDAQSWEWGGMAMAFNPDGDPGSRSDGFPGSLFGAGHDVWNLISEIGIPAPVRSERKVLADLPTARVLQPFADIKGDLFPWIEEMPRVGIELIPPPNEQETGKLIACWGAHLQDEHATHMSCELDLDSPDPQGPWLVTGLNPYNGNDYLFTIPEDWAEAYTQGFALATGRYRDGGWSGFGPTLAAVDPWHEGNSPPAGTTLPSVILLKYSDYYNGEPDPWHEMNGYAHSDEWSGGVWVRAGLKEAVIFVGTKGIGNTWYGNPEGPCLDCENRGWWSDTFEGWFLFYDPNDLAKVAEGGLQPWEPQPYAHLNIDEYLYYISSAQEKQHAGACCYDNKNRLLYLFEGGRGEGERTLIHVWRIQTE